MKATITWPYDVDPEVGFPVRHGGRTIGRVTAVREGEIDVELDEAGRDLLRSGYEHFGLGFQPDPDEAYDRQLDDLRLESQDDDPRG